MRMCRHDLFDTYVLNFPMTSVMTIKVNCKSCMWETTAVEEDKEVKWETNTRLTDKSHLYHIYTCNSCIVHLTKRSNKLCETSVKTCFSYYFISAIPSQYHLSIAKTREPKDEQLCLCSAHITIC